LGEDGSLDVPAAALAAKLQSKLQASVGSDAETKDAGLVKTITLGSETADLSKSTTEDNEPLEATKSITEGSGLTQLSPAVTKATEAASSILGPDEPLVTSTAPGSIDAPGAFPDAGGDTGAGAGGVLLEQSSTIDSHASAAEHIIDVQEDVKPVAAKTEDGSQKEKEKEEAPSTAATAASNNGAGYTQSFAG
jgi:hypothetical protein